MAALLREESRQLGMGGAVKSLWGVRAQGREVPGGGGESQGLVVECGNGMSRAHGRRNQSSEDQCVQEMGAQSVLGALPIVLPPPTRTQDLGLG